MTEEDETIATVHVEGEPPVEVDVQDPLPEASWRYRRIITYALTLAMAAGIGYMVHVIHDIIAVLIDKLDTLNGADLKDIIVTVFGLMGKIVSWTYCFMALLLTYYLIAPSAEQVVKMFKLAAIFRGGVSLPTPDAPAKPQYTERRTHRPQAPSYRPIGRMPTSGDDWSDEDHDAAPRGRR